MKKLTTLMFFLCLGYGLSAQVKISGTGSTTAANASSVLELEATDKGLLIPRVSSLSNIVSPAEGLLVYQTSDSKVYIRKSTAWEVVGGGTSGVSISNGGGNISSNIAIGTSSLTANTTGLKNIAIGNNAMKFNLIGKNNIAIGENSSGFLSGSNNIIIGDSSSFIFEEGSNNIVIGKPNRQYTSYDPVLQKNISYNSLIIANIIKATGINDETSLNMKLSIGGASFNSNALMSVSGQIASSGYITTSDRRFKKNIRSLEPGLSAVLQLKPAAYNWDTSNERMASANPNQLQYGFIAQELETVLPDLVSGDGSTQDYKSVNYIELIPILTKSIQELKSLIDDQNSMILELKKKIEN